MNFEWSRHQEELYGACLEFARGHLNRSVDERETRHEFGHAEWKACGDFGVLGLCVPREYGGAGLDALTTARTIEALGRGCEDTGLVFSICAHLFAAVMPIVEHGSEEMKRTVLPRLCDGSGIAANAITEAEAGSDAFALQTRCEHEGQGYILNGVKSYVTNGPVADIFVVYATRNPAWGHMGISAFVVERDRQGVVVGEPFHKMGLTTSPISSLYLDDCRVPQLARVGDEGKGASVFRASMLWERACLFAAYVGVMDRELDRVVEHAQARRQFRKKIGSHQAVAHRIADMKLRLESARLLLYRACWSKGRGSDAQLEISMAKLAVSEAAIKSSLDAIHLHGGQGYVTEGGIERGLRNAIPSAIFSGTSEIQRDLIANSLGL